MDATATPSAVRGVSHTVMVPVIRYAGMTEHTSLWQTPVRMSSLG
jgi:hypothetical protein